MNNLILLNGRIFSVSGDGKRERGTAIAIADGRIKAIGTDDEIREYIDADSQVIDCGGNSIVPAFTDGHLHTAMAASIFENCNLFEISCTEEETSDDAVNKYVQEVKKFIEERPDQANYRGTGWNRAFFNGGCRNMRWPNRHDLDAICADKPVVLESYCQHMMWTNTKAIELAGLSADTKDPVNGTITRDETGYPDGVFMEMEALDLIKKGLPGYDYSVEQYKNAFLRFQEEIALPAGIGMVNDCMSTDNYIEAMKQLAEEKKLKLRARGSYLIDDLKDHESIKAFGRRKGSDDIDETFRIDTLKVFFDGNYAMLEPYEEDYIKDSGLPEGYKGDLFYSDEEARDGLTVAAETGMQIHIHAMGDAGIKQAVEGLAFAQEKSGKQMRNVIAHLMAVDPADIRTMGKAGIMANVQPRWMTYDTDIESSSFVLFGKEKSLNFYPYKSFLNEGVHAACGTDFPVLPSLNPFEGIECGVTRCIYKEASFYEERFDGKPLGPEDNPTKECVSLEELIRSYTYEGAYQNFIEEESGSIEIGKSADLVILDSNLEQVAPRKLHYVTPEKTIFRGEIVYSK